MCIILYILNDNRYLDFWCRYFSSKFRVATSPIDYLPLFAIQPYTTEPLSTFTFNTSTTMVSRMLLNLHQAVDDEVLSPSWTDVRDSYVVSSYFDRREEGISIRRRRGHAGESSSVIVLDTVLWEDIDINN
jgi:hypothetical protein